jgi:LysR family glycine cleavage system transcriptional activator
MAIVYDRPNVDDRVTDLLGMVRVAPLCAPGVAAAAKGASLADFLADAELLHLKLENQPRELLWRAYLSQRGISLPLNGGLAFDTSIALARYAMTSGGVFLGDVDMFASELASGDLVMPFDAIAEDGYGYYLKLHADDLADPEIAAFRTWLIGHFKGMRAQ